MDSRANSEYTYYHLSKGCIRLLLLDPSDDQAAPISCRLSSISIGERPYEALSYVWGQEDATNSILIDDQKVMVRPNLHAALQELRLDDKPRALWVDALCINQSDIAERSDQVGRMKEIYSTAKQVIIWLGEQNHAVGASFDFFQGLSTLDLDLADRIDAGSGLSWEHRQLVFKALGMKHGIDDYDKVAEGLKELMSNPWWSRIWTVQEVVLAKSAVLRCGSKSASWDCLSKLAAFSFEVARHNAMSFGRPMDESILDELTAEVSKLYIAVRALSSLSQRVSRGVHVDLEEMAWSQLLTRRATDPLDMIYGLAGLLTNRDMVRIDYARSKKQVYTDAMRAMLEKGDFYSLHLLQDCYPQRDCSLPSWVPDFGILHSFRTINMATVGVGSTLSLGSLYNVSGGGDAEDAALGLPKFLGDNLDILQLQGVPVDEVSTVGAICSRFPNGREERELQLRLILKTWRELLPKTENGYVRGGSLLEAFWRTVTFDLLLEDRDYYAGRPNRRDYRLPEGAVGMPPKTKRDEDEVLDGILDAPPPKTVLEKLGERRFFITKSGYFGLGSSLMQPGDTVCALRGALFPTAIRPAKDGRYTWIGECFLHGIMDGEMTVEIKEGKTSWRDFQFS